MVDAMDTRGEGGDADAYHLLQPRVPRHAGRVRRQPQAHRDLPAAHQRAVAVPPPEPRRRDAAAALGDGTHGIVKAIDSGDPERAGRAMREHVSREPGAHVAQPPRRRATPARPLPRRRSTRHARRQRPPLRAAHRTRPSSSASTAASRTTWPRPWPRPHALDEAHARRRHRARRRLRGAELHQPEQPVDRHRRAAVGARHLRQLPVRRRDRHRSHDERPEVAARADASSPRSPTPARRSPSSPRRTSCARCSATA